MASSEKGLEEESGEKTLLPLGASSKEEAASVAALTKRKYAHHDGSHASYMEAKQAKLKEQFEETGFSLGGKAIFIGLAFWVDGQTNGVDATELSRLILKHGGQVFNVFESKKVSHVVCETLAANKLWVQLQKKKSKHTFVKPKWVLDCVAAQKLVAIKPQHLVVQQKQTTIKDLWGSRKVMTQSDTVPLSLSNVPEDVWNSLSKSAQKDVQDAIDQRQRDDLHAPAAVVERNLREEDDKGVEPERFSQIDREVFDAMPDHIQQSIRRRLRPKEKDASPQRRQKKNKENKNLLLFAPETCDFERVALPLQSFMRRCIRPGGPHADLLVEFFRSTMKRSLADAAACLRLICDLADHELPRWKTTVDAVLRRTQNMVQNSFHGATLAAFHYSPSPPPQKNDDDHSNDDEDLENYPDEYFLDR